MSIIFYKIEIEGNQKNAVVEKGKERLNVLKFCALVLANHTELNHHKLGDLTAYKSGSTKFEEDDELRDKDLYDTSKYFENDDELRGKDLHGISEDCRIIVKINVKGLSRINRIIKEPLSSYFHLISNQSLNWSYNQSACSVNQD